MAALVPRLCAVSRTSSRRLFASAVHRHAMRPFSVTSTRAASSEAAPLFPPAADLAVAGNEMPPSAPPDLAPPEDGATDWSKSYSGLSQQAFSKEVADVLLTPLESKDIEVKPDGLLYLPEIKYRRILNRAFGPGAWGLAPRSETNVGPRIVSREYALVCLGRLVAIARGEQEYFDPSGIPTATEACKSNALMRCCKDLGIASELWDPRFIREFKAQYCVEVFAEHIPTKKKKKLWRRKDQPKLGYPYQE
ncbi:mitochondrial genome maintenance MGM101-domain-containing protein [Mycena pura]|uniref:Mitochondrial genome maintenance protein MGM101 n=1 Tax=Mycena pura TaxID=153505 RepID=A0AAD6YA59_9AGAR|nr:mitochondrial genome maintenance MGM101-domain-containing protein [Mycena pura]